MHKIPMKNTKMPVSMENWIMDDGAYSICSTRGKTENRTTLGPLESLLTRPDLCFFFVSFWVESDSSQSYCTAFFIFAPPL